VQHAGMRCSTDGAGRLCASTADLRVRPMKVGPHAALLEDHGRF